MKHGTGILLAALALAACGGGGGGSTSTPATGGSGSGLLEVLSNRADLISGDDVLVGLTLPADVVPASVVLKVNGAESEAVAGGVDANGRYLARVTNLALGPNTLTATWPGGSANATLVNHPNGGPVFSGPQVQPWTCQQGALDAQCNQQAEYTFLYKSTDSNKTGLQPYDPEHPATDVATTTTDGGKTLPFIVRQERGYQDRDEYLILALFQLGQDWRPWAPQEQWNRKLLITHGGGCGNDHGSYVSKLDDYAGTIPANPAYEQSYIVALGLGYAVGSTALDNNGHNCNLVVQAESLMMMKERLVEHYGTLRYTIGTGCSGGSLAQQWISNSYPGIYQGLLTMCSYPDVFSPGVQFADYHLLRIYFNDFPADCSPVDTSGCSPDDAGWVASTSSPASRGVAWTQSQWAAVEGHQSHANAVAADDGLFKGATYPTRGCWGVPAEQIYDADSNPAGVRCGLLDYMINVLGPRPPEVWSPMEVAAGRGFGGNFVDNVGVQYGLAALRSGSITPAQFVDLNAYIGGLTIDIKPQPQRVAADRTALANAYRSGAINETNNLDRVAIINFTGPDPGIAHDSVHTFWTRWRLDREHGNHDNHVIWEGPVALVGDPNYVTQGLAAMDRWLAAVEKDPSDTPLPAKLTAHKPADVHDQCSDGQGNKASDGLCPDAVVPVYDTPRTVAGDVDTADTMKCGLKPLNRMDDYGPLGVLTFTDAQWAQLEAAFPDGVCDYTAPAEEQQGAVAWMNYGDAVNHVYGGAALPAAPAGVAPGWAGDAFSPAP